MNSLGKKIMMFLVLSFMTTQLHAEGISESAYMLKGAMMESNADYNKHKKRINNDEFDRADEWGERETKAISISGAQMRPIASDEEFQELKSEYNMGDREVSSNESN